MLAALPPPSIPPPADDNAPDLFTARREPEGSTDDSSSEGEKKKEKKHKRSNEIPPFKKATGWFQEYLDACNDPNRVRTASELPPSHSWHTVETQSRADRRDFKAFQDAMYSTSPPTALVFASGLLRILSTTSPAVLLVSGC